MDKLKYTEVEMEISSFEEEDVIVCSTGGLNDNGTEIEGDG